MKDLRGKTAIVTGASRGLGVHIATALAERGVNLVLTARDAQKLDETKQLCEARGVRVLCVSSDITSVDDQRALVAAAEREFGAIDIVVNNAGLELVSALTEMSTDQIDAVIRTNLNAPIWLTKLVLPSMLARDSGVVVQIASLAGKSPVPFDSLYAATKAGLINFADSLATELQGTNVRSAVVCPGFVSDAGMWADRAAGGAKKPFTLGTVSPQKVAKGVIRAIEGSSEVLVAPTPMRPLFVLGQVSPALRHGIVRALGLTKSMRTEAHTFRNGADRADTEAQAAPTARE